MATCAVTLALGWWKQEHPLRALSTRLARMGSFQLSERQSDEEDTHLMYCSGL